jgi:hypothetical protein
MATNSAPPHCNKHNRQMVLYFYDKPLGLPGNRWGCPDCDSKRVFPAAPDVTGVAKPLSERMEAWIENDCVASIYTREHTKQFLAEVRELEQAAEIVTKTLNLVNEQLAVERKKNAAPSSELLDVARRMRFEADLIEQPPEMQMKAQNSLRFWAGEIESKIANGSSKAQLDANAENIALKAQLAAVEIARDQFYLQSKADRTELLKFQSTRSEAQDWNEFVESECSCSGDSSTCLFHQELPKALEIAEKQFGATLAARFSAVIQVGISQGVFNCSQGRSLAAQPAKCPYCGHDSHLPPNWDPTAGRWLITCQWGDDKITCNCPAQIPRYGVTDYEVYKLAAQPVECGHSQSADKLAAFGEAERIKELMGTQVAAQPAPATVDAEKVREPRTVVETLNDGAELWTVTEPNGEVQRWRCYESTPSKWICDLLDVMPLAALLPGKE